MFHKFWGQQLCKIMSCRPYLPFGMVPGHQQKLGQQIRAGLLFHFVAIKQTGVGVVVKF